MIEQGTVKWFDVKKGFGFIVQSNGKDLFLHKTGIHGDGFVEEGMPVKYEITEGPKGPCATAVQPV